jgi:hypothetical protein
VIVTFGAGGGVCANTAGASIARMTKVNTAVSKHLLITASSDVVSSNQLVAETQRRHHQQLHRQ